MSFKFLKSFPSLPRAFQSTINTAQARSGVFVSNLSTKASEGLSGMGARFGDNIPFLKAGAITPSFAELLKPGGIGRAFDSALAGVSGKLGIAFGGKKGMLPDSLINNLVASKDPKASAVAIKEAGYGGQATEDRSHMVSLTSIIDPEKVVEFLVMPEVVENRTVGYDPVAPPQFPGAFQKYKGTESVQWTINATLISRTSAEASENLKNMNLLRGWTMPFFGENTRQAYPDRIGAPPPVLMLRGLRKAIIGPMPVVITSLSWNWPKDVDYIPATLPDKSASNIPFPTVIQIAIQCVESLSTQQFNQFDLNDYFDGNMIDAYRKPIAINRNEDYGNEGRNYPAQTVDQSGANYSNEGRNARPSNPDFSNEGRNARPSNPDYSNEGRNSQLKTAPFKSGGGGDFGGGGATGSWAKLDAVTGG